MQRYIAGDSIRQIAREEQRDRATVTKIVRSDEMNAFIQEMRERFYGLAPDALATIEHALREEKDARIGLEVLRDIGVRPSKGQSLPLPATAPEDGYSRQDAQRGAPSGLHQRAGGRGQPWPRGCRLFPPLLRKVK